MGDGLYREHTLRTVVILSAFVPTLIAQQFFRPRLPSKPGVPAGTPTGPRSADSEDEFEVEATS